MLEISALLLVALLFGGMTLYSFGFAAFLFTALPPQVAGAALRRAFPHFYLFVLLTSAAAALLVCAQDSSSALWLSVIVVTTAPVRQLLMPAINTATDTGAKARFKALHSLSVLISVAHIAIAGYVLARFV